MSMVLEKLIFAVYDVCLLLAFFGTKSCYSFAIMFLLNSHPSSFSEDFHAACYHRYALSVA